MPLTWAVDGDVGVLEDAGVEVGEQQALGDLTEALLGLLLTHVGLHVLEGGGALGGIVPATHLVNASGDGLGDALAGVPVGALEAPGGRHAGVGVVDDGPVGAGRALEAEALAQELGDLVLGEAGAQVLAVLLVLVVGDGVGGHDGRGAAGLAVELEGTIHERDHEALEVLAGIDGVLAAVGVALAAALAGALGRPVLDHGGHGVLAPAEVVAAVVNRGLHAVDEGLHRVAREGGILAEGAGEARPAGVGGNVGLRAEEHVDAHLAQVLGLAAGGLAGDLGVKRRGKRQVAGPVGGVLAGARVGREVDRELVLGALGVGLHVVGPGRLLVGGITGGRVQDGADAAVEEGLLLVGHGAVVLDLGLVGREAHEAVDLLEGDTLGQVGGALLGAQSPVLVRHELARALEVLEGVAVLLDELEAGFGRVAQLLAVAVVDQHPAVVGLGLSVARALGLGALRGGLGCGVAAAREPCKSGRHGGRRDEAPTRDLACHVVLPSSQQATLACPSLGCGYGRAKTFRKQQRRL